MCRGRSATSIPMSCDGITPGLANLMGGRGPGELLHLRESGGAHLFATAGIVEHLANRPRESRGIVRLDQHAGGAHGLWQRAAIGGYDRHANRHGLHSWDAESFGV